MGFEFPAANELRYRAVQRERIEKIYVVGNEETGFLRVESWRADDLSFCAREKNNATAKSALQPVMLFGIEKNGEDNQDRNGNRKMQKADYPEKCAAQKVPGTLHT